MKLKTRQQITSKLTCYAVLTFLLSANVTLCVDRRTNNHQLNQDVPSESSDTNIDSSDPSAYDQSIPTDSRDEEGSLPSATEISVIRLNDTSVVLRWDFSESHQERLQYFKIQYKSTRKGAEWKTDNREIPPTTRAYQINGLRPGNFLFTVVAVYDNDDNVHSRNHKYKLRARSKIKAEELPEQTAPKIFWQEAKYDFFRFKWNYLPKEKDTPYFGYLVFYRSAHTVTDFTIYNTLDENVEIAEVESDTPYEAKVVAYNQVSVSEFSETITIKTEPKPNSTVSTTSTTVPSTVMTTTTTTTTTIAPITFKKPWISSNNEEIKSTSIAPAERTTTMKPIIINGPIQTNSTTINPVYRSLTSFIDLILGDQSDTILIVRYMLLVLLPIVFIALALTCLMSRHRVDKESPPSTTDNSMQFHLEINGYFKNSFPGVERDYPSIENHNGHHGFVNTQPHIDDFA